MKKNIFTLCCILFVSTSLYSESVYTLSWQKDGLIGALSLGVFLPPFFMEAAPGDPVNKLDINLFDRSLMFSYNKPLDSISTWSAYGALILPGLSVLGNIKDTNALFTYGIMYTEAFLLTYGTKDLLKFAVARNRPYTYFGDVPAGDEEDYYNSFPSGHTAFAFLGASFLSATFAAEYPDSKWKAPLIAGSYTLATGIALMRILSGNHFLTDVLVGAAIGSFYGRLVPALHARPGNDVAFAFTGNGLLVSIRL